MARLSGRTDIDGVLPKLGKAIRARRKLAGLSQEALADAAGIDRSHMGKYERGERNVMVLNVWRIANALNCSMASLLSDADL